MPPLHVESNFLSVIVFHHDFVYRASTWKTARREIREIKHSQSPSGNPGNQTSHKAGKAKGTQLIV
jgi:hypothetical protein